MNIFAQKAKIYLSNAAKAIKFSNIKESLVPKSKPVPVHIAMTGLWQGYNGSSFELTQDMFQQAIANFESENTPLPCYRGHADLNGSVEEPKNEGWILSLSTDGTNLWALCEFTEELEADIAAGRYKFSSIYMHTDATDRITGQSIGARLCSLAITSMPFIDGLSAITLSQNSNKPNIYTKEIQMTKKQIKLAQDMKEAACAVTPEQDSAPAMAEDVKTMDDMQQGKTVESDPMAMIEEAKNALYPDMALEDFIKQLLEAFKAEEAAEPAAEEVMEPAVDEVTEPVMAQASPEDVAKAESVDKQEEDKLQEVAASSMALASTVKSLNLALSTAKKEIDSLRSEIKKRDEVVLSAIVEDAINKGKLLDQEKASFIKLGSVDRSLFDELLKARGHKPAIALGRIIASDEKEAQNVGKVSKALSSIEQQILSGAKIKY